MDWPLAIDRNRAALLAIVAAILALVGEDGPVARSVRSAALALLRPAESAVRRLIVMAARGLAVKPGDRRPAPVVPSPEPVEGSKDDRTPPRAAGAKRPPAFSLFDRRKRYGRMLQVVRPPGGVPRIRTFWEPPVAPLAVAPSAVAPAARPDPDALVDIGRLRIRLASLGRALADLPRQARRLARWRARRAASPDRLFRSPLRIGHPPGHRRRAARDIDRVLADCHALARKALAFDSS